MEPKQLLININYVISIHLFPEKESNDCTWVEDHTYVKRRLIGNHKIIKVPGHYVDYYGETICGPELFTDPSNLRSIRYHIKKTGKRDEGIKGTLFEKACIKFVIVGGKYTGEEWVYFDTYEKACNFIEDIENTYPDKFLIVKHQ